MWLKSVHTFAKRLAQKKSLECNAGVTAILYTIRWMYSFWNVIAHKIFTCVCLTAAIKEVPAARQSLFLNVPSKPFFLAVSQLQPDNRSAQNFRLNFFYSNLITLIYSTKHRRTSVSFASFTFVIGLIFTYITISVI